MSCAAVISAWKLHRECRSQRAKHMSLAVTCITTEAFHGRIERPRSALRADATLRSSSSTKRQAFRREEAAIFRDGSSPFQKTPPPRHVSDRSSRRRAPGLEAFRNVVAADAGNGGSAGGIRWRSRRRGSCERRRGRDGVVGGGSLPLEGAGGAAASDAGTRAGRGARAPMTTRLSRTSAPASDRAHIDGRARCLPAACGRARAAAARRARRTRRRSSRATPWARLR
jgi:hypothetical protein